MFIKTAVMDWNVNPITKTRRKGRVNDSVVERNVQ